MPKKGTLKTTNETIQLADTPFAHGGEAELFQIVAPSKYRNYVAKVYFPQKRTERQAQKIHYLVNNPPELALHEGHQSVIWMSDSLYVNGQFVGFIMPYAKGAKLELLCSSRIPKQFANDWNRFSFKQKGSRELRLKICFNLATAVYQIHKTQRYVVVDLKPDNILIQPNGLVSIVDIDSVQVVENNRMLYPARVATPEFSPPEYYRDAKPGKTVIFETWDRFSLAVIFYKMLFGIHPYAGSSLPPFDKYVNLQDKIKYSLFVHSPSRRSNFKVIPPPHKAFYHLPAHIQNLFVRCFEYGHDNAYERPSANEWCWGTTPRQPLIPIRKLPSMALPMKAVQYSTPISLTAKGDDIQIPNLQTQPPRNITYQALDSNFRLPRIVFGSTAIATVLWLSFTPFGFTNWTFIQLLSLATTSLGILAVDYYSLSATKEKHLAQQFKKKIGNAKREKRALVNQLIRQMQRRPKADLTEQKRFYHNQNQILQEEREQIDEIVGAYRHEIHKKDQKVLLLSQEELDQVIQLEKKLTETIDISIEDGLKYLPLPEKLAWVEQRLKTLNHADAPNLKTQLTKIKEELTEANTLFDEQRKNIATQYELAHQSINEAAAKAYQEMSEKIKIINLKITERKKELFETVFSNQANLVEAQNEEIQKIKKEILELGDLYQNFNTVSNKVLEYKDISFKKYLKRIFS